MLRCPWHGWEFSLRTGQSWFDPKLVRVRRYDVTVEPGAALLEAEPSCEADLEGMEGMLKGPYTAETFPVFIEEQCMVFDIGRPSAVGPR